LNAGPDHLSLIETGDEPTNLEGLPNAQIFSVCLMDGNFEDIIHFLTAGTEPKEYSIQQKKELVGRAANFPIIARHLYKMGNDEIFRRYAPEFE